MSSDIGRETKNREKQRRKRGNSQWKKGGKGGEWAQTKPVQSGGINLDCMEKRQEKRREGEPLEAGEEELNCQKEKAVEGI